MLLDEELISQIIFHPRPEFHGHSPVGKPTLIQSGDAEIAGYLHECQFSNTLLILFHGNGEIAADYDFFIPMYIDCGVSCWVVDYRGYGRSTGTPSFSNMLQDAEAIYASVLGLRGANQNKFSQVIVMGRSLGSAPAIHLAAKYSSSLAGLILDSPFADGLALIARLGGLEISKKDWPSFEDNIDKIKQCRLPTLIIHGTDDLIIPVTDAEALYKACPSQAKQLLKLEGGGHNDLLSNAFIGDYYSNLK